MAEVTAPSSTVGGSTPADGVTRSASVAVGASGTAVPGVSAIGRPLVAAWLDELAPAPRRAVESWALANELDAELGDGIEAELLELAPSAAQTTADLELELRAGGDVPPLVELPSGDLYYSAGGTTYRRVPRPMPPGFLGLNLAAAVPVEELARETSAPWPIGSTPASAFAETGRYVAASGSVLDAVRFAATWLSSG